MKKLLLYLALLLVLVSSASAIGYFSERMNFPPGESRQHRQILTNDGGAAIQINATVPSGFSVVATDCNQIGSVISCDIAAGTSKYYTLNSPANSIEGTTYKSYLTSNGGFSGDFTFVCIPDNKITDCKVEYGHGDANYLSNNQLFISNETATIFNLLRVWNIGHYLSPNEAARNASVKCTYENYPVRTYGRVEINHGTNEVNGTFLWSIIESGYWFRIGVVSQDVGGMTVGDTYDVSCGNLTYQFAHHQVVAESSTCDLEIRGTGPFTCSVAAHPTLAGKLVMTLTNNEKYSVYDISFDKTLNSVKHTETYWQLNSGNSVAYVIDNGTEDDIDLFFVPSWQINSWTPQYYTQSLDCSNATAPPLPGNTPPTLVSNIPDQSWLINTNKTNAFDLDTYFTDANGDSLNYTCDNVSNITIVISSGNLVSFIPDFDWFGTRNTTCYANDSINVTASNLFNLHVYYCGDGTCDATESCSLCPADCGVCPPPPPPPSGGSGGGGGGGKTTPIIEEEEEPLELEEVPETICGDNFCDIGEDSDICCGDCGCLEGYECFENMCIEIPVELEELPGEPAPALSPLYFLNPDVLDEELLEGKDFFDKFSYCLFGQESGRGEKPVLNYAILRLYYSPRGPGLLNKCVIPEEFIWRKTEEFLNFKILDEENGDSAILDYSILNLEIELEEYSPMWGPCNWICFCRIIVILSVILLMFLVPYLIRRVKEEAEVEDLIFEEPERRRVVRKVNADVGFIKPESDERCLLGDVPDYPKPGPRKQFYVVYILLFLVLSIGGLVWTYPGSYITGAEVYSPGFNVMATMNISQLVGNYSYYEEEDGSKAGEAVARGLINGDNFIDLIIGAPMFNSGDGKVYVLFRPFANGSNNLSVANVSFTGATGNESLGNALAVGDVNNDGLTDILVGARWKDDGGFPDTGGAYLIYNDGNLNGTYDNISLVSNVTFYGETIDIQAGSALAIGDLSGDGIDDLIIGAPLFDDLPSTDSGRVYVVYGPVANNANFNLIVSNTTITSPGTNLGRFGAEVIVADINGDSQDDLIIGEPGAERVHLIFGPLSATGSVNIWDTANATFNGTSGWTGDRHTLSVGNVNNDGYDDLLIGAPYDQEYGMITYGSGRAFLVYGNDSSNFVGNISLNITYPQWYPEALDDALGFSTELDDYDGDGLDDVYLGAPGNDEGGSLAGKIYVFKAPFGGNASNASTADDAWIGSEAGQGLGLISKGSTIFGSIFEGTGSAFITLSGLDPPIANFVGVPVAGDAPLNVAFTDTSTGTVTSWSWDFENDGTPDSIVQNPGHTYAAAGTYSVKLIVEGPDGSSSLTKINYITANVPAPVPTPTGGGGGGGTVSNKCTAVVPLTAEPNSFVTIVVDADKDSTFSVEGWDADFTLVGRGEKIFDLQIPDIGGVFNWQVKTGIVCAEGTIEVIKPEEEVIPGVLEIIIPKSPWPEPINTYSRQGKRVEEKYSCETRDFEVNELENFLTSETQTVGSLTGALSYSGDEYYFAWDVVPGDSEISYGFVNEDGFDSNPWLDYTTYRDVGEGGSTGEIVTCPVDADYMFISNGKDEIKLYFEDEVKEYVLEIVGQHVDGRNVILKADLRELSSHEFVEEVSGPFEYLVEIGDEEYSGYFNSQDVRYVLNTETGDKFVEMAEGAVFNIKVKVLLTDDLFGKKAFVKLGDDVFVVGDKAPLNPDEWVWDPVTASWVPKQPFPGYEGVTEKADLKNALCLCDKWVSVAYRCPNKMIEEKVKKGEEVSDDDLIESVKSALNPGQGSALDYPKIVNGADVSIERVWWSTEHRPSGLNVQLLGPFVICRKDAETKNGPPCPDEEKCELWCNLKSMPDIWSLLSQVKEICKNQATLICKEEPLYLSDTIESSDWPKSSFGVESGCYLPTTIS